MIFSIIKWETLYNFLKSKNKLKMFVAMLFYPQKTYIFTTSSLSKVPSNSFSKSTLFSINSTKLYGDVQPTLRSLG
jgi:hypothetical protein